MQREAGPWPQASFSSFLLPQNEVGFTANSQTNGLETSGREAGSLAGLGATALVPQEMSSLYPVHQTLGLLEATGIHIKKPTKVRLVKAMVFPVVVYGSESWTVKKAEC